MVAQWLDLFTHSWRTLPAASQSSLGTDSRRSSEPSSPLASDPFLMTRADTWAGFHEWESSGQQAHQISKLCSSGPALCSLGSALDDCGVAWHPALRFVVPS